MIPSAKAWFREAGLIVSGAGTVPTGLAEVAARRGKRDTGL